MVQIADVRGGVCTENLIRIWLCNDGPDAAIPLPVARQNVSVHADTMVIRGNIGQQ